MSAIVASTRSRAPSVRGREAAAMLATKV
jgi:hypothetical protein